MGIKIFLHKNKWNVFLLLFLSIFFLIFEYQAITLKEFEDEMEQNIDGLSDNALIFALDYEFEDFSFLEKEKSSFAIIKRIKEECYLYEVIFSKCFFERDDGIYLDLSDFSEKNICIYGEKADMVNDLSDLTSYFKGSEYTLWGRLKNCASISQQYGIYIFNSNRTFDNTDHVYIIEADTAAASLNILKSVEKEARKNNISISIIEREHNEISQMVDMTWSALMVVTIVIVLLGGSTYLALSIWVKKNKQAIYPHVVAGKRYGMQQIGGLFWIITIFSVILSGGVSRLLLDEFVLLYFIVAFVYVDIIFLLAYWREK